MQKQLIDPEEITTNYRKTDWSGALYILLAAAALAYVIAHVVVYVQVFGV